MIIKRSTRSQRALSALALTCGFSPITTHALGVLEPELRSHLNEPLEVEIPLVLTAKEKNTDIVIQQIVGKYPNISDWVPELNFSLTSDSQDNFTIIASTLLPVNEPIVHFTVSIDTGSVWIQREMSFLLDPKPVQNLATSKARIAKPKVVLKPSEARSREAAPTSEVSAPSTPDVTEDASTYIVKAGDSLSLIAQSFSHNRDATIAQAMVSIFRANRKAFINDDVNKIKAHYEIIIPDEAQMKLLSSAEARNVFYNLLASEERSTPQTPIVDAPIDRAPNVVQTDEEQAEPLRPVADTPKQEQAAPTPPASPPDAEPEEKAEPLQGDLAAQEETEIKTEGPASDYELRLATNDAGVPVSTINENEGTIVFEGQETAITRAASPSPEVKQAMRSAVDDMEGELATLRKEVKNLRQSLQGKENLLALRTETKLSSPPAEQIPTPPEQKPPPVDKAQGPIELDVSNSAESDEGFDFLRLLLEILTLGAAGAFIGYLIVFKRKRETDENGLATNKYFRPSFSSDKSGPLPATPGAIQAASDMMPTTHPEAPQPEDHSTDDYIASSPRFNLDKKDSIEVTEEAYDDSIDFTHSSEEADKEGINKAPESIIPPPSEPGGDEEFNAEYILQEANLSIAFKDLENAHFLLTKLTNNVPRNPDYRVLMLGVLKNLQKEEEFIYHANHLANITNKSCDTPWQQAYEIGQQFLPGHPLFSSPPTAGMTGVKSLLDDEVSITNVTPMNSPDTIVLDTRRALAEYERKMLEKEALENSSDKHQVLDEEVPVLDLNELSDRDSNRDQSFSLNLEDTPSEGITTADESEQAEDLSDEFESLSAQTTSSPEEPAGSPEVSDEVERILEYDNTPAPDTAQEAVAQQGTPDKPSIENIIDLNLAVDEPREQGTAMELSSEHLDELTSETLASMAEFSAIEGIPLDENILRQLHKSEDKEEDEGDEDDTVLIKPK